MRQIRRGPPTQSDGRLLYRMSGPVRRFPDQDVKRPDAEYLTNEITKTTRLDLPHGCFNGGMVADPVRGGYILAFRPREFTFSLCRLDAAFNITTPPIDLGITNCADPRLVWLPGGRLLLIYSSFDTDPADPIECMRGAVLLDPQVHPTQFLAPARAFRISPPHTARQKNWMPFVHDDRLHLIASVRPHIVYTWDKPGEVATQRYESPYTPPWFNTEFFRGNTNPVQLDDGNFLGTFHTVIREREMHFYDNGCYVFEGKPPFKVLRCSRRCYLPAEAATEPHFRKIFRITVCFPVGMVREGDRLLISYGDNDSAVKIGETTVTQMLATTLPVY
jgi:predicted GH43/DUF377 family glycosyl hydrolase